ncbi:MAG: glycogen debranching protein GlgX [Bacteroidetes bacterium]|nr:glycogen debranching protein GlgX [Bacteroidota bacterium]
MGIENGSRKRADSGRAHPIGASLIDGGVNFSLFSRNGTSVELLLFNHVNDAEPVQVIQLDRSTNKSYHYWHVFVPGIRAGQLYAYRVHGPFDPANGHRFDSNKILLDPYGKAVAVPDGFNRKAFITPGKSNHPAMKSVVVDLSGYDWEGDTHPERPFSQTIIYEMHVAGFTRHPNSGVTPQFRGTYRGLIEKIPYLVDLGITAIELLPVFQFDEQDCPVGRVNYWGYCPVSFFAPHQGYATSKNPLQVINDFRDMVKALHRAGIEVILDVVFNHTAENAENGPTYSFKGIDNSIYYILKKNKAKYANYSGTGNSLNANQPIVRRMIIDALHFWVKEMHVDGFRFDLASILSRDQTGHTLENPPVLWDIESDPVLAGVKLIAEAWDAAGLYQVGSFVGDSWKEWNGKFRDDVRSFMKGDYGMLSNLTSRLIASPDIYAHKNREPEQSINFITCHDGFTLNDLVSYNEKHNEANGEHNRDGNDHNLSWNCGVEGPTDDPQIESLRNRQVKNFLTITLISLGVPMVLMGDEVRRTQQGNNNAYCHDSELAWFDWSLLERHADVHRFLKILIAIRSKRDTAQQKYIMSLKELLKNPLITWHGIKLNSPDWSDHSLSIAFTVRSVRGSVVMHYMLNAYSEPLGFELPSPNGDPELKWKRWIDTSLPSPQDICYWEEAPLHQGASYTVQPHSIAILFSRPNYKNA